MTTGQPTERFVNVPAPIRRHAFLQGRVTLPEFFTPRPAKRKTDGVAKPKKNDARANCDRNPIGRRKLHAAISLARLTRKQRKRLLELKCKAAGVTNACALALAK